LQLGDSARVFFLVFNPETFLIDFLDFFLDLFKRRAASAADEVLALGTASIIYSKY
jgi:hypothetical protein